MARGSSGSAGHSGDELVGAGVERSRLADAVERLVVERRRALRDLLRLALLELTDEVGRCAADETTRSVVLEACAAVGDVEVAHRELTDTVTGAECGVLHALHRELLARVRQRRAGGVENRVVLAAA